MDNRFKFIAIIFAVVFVTSGVSIVYMHHVAANSNTEQAKLYPAASDGMGGVTIDSVILAENIINHHVFSRSLEAPFEPDVWRTPGHPIFVAAVYYVFGDFYSVLVANILLLFFTAVLIFKIAEHLMPQKLALAVSLLYAVLPDSLLSTSALFSENLFVLVLILAVYVLFFSKIKNIYLKWALTGLLLAATVYIRPASQYILLFFIPAYFILFLKKSEITRKHFIAAGLLILVFLGTMSPWCIRNREETGIWSFNSAGAFVLFYQAAWFYQAMHPLDPLKALHALEDMAGIPRGPVPEESKYSHTLQTVALQVIFAHPWRYTVFHLSGLVPFFTSTGSREYMLFVKNMLPHDTPISEPTLIQALNQFSIPTLIVVLKNHGWTLLESILWAILTILAFWSAWRSKDKKLARVFLAIVMYFALVTGPISHARYRIPAEPFLLICAFSTLAYFVNEKKINLHFK